MTISEAIIRKCMESVDNKFNDLEVIASLSSFSKDQIQVAIDELVDNEVVDLVRVLAEDGGKVYKLTPKGSKFASNRYPSSIKEGAV
jgi:predicted transcriptional regulator